MIIEIKLSKRQRQRKKKYGCAFKLNSHRCPLDVNISNFLVDSILGLSNSDFEKFLKSLEKTVEKGGKDENI